MVVGVIATFAVGSLALAPGDVVNRYVDLSNTGSLTGKNLTLSASDSGSTLLSTDATKGLHVTVTSCSVAWVAAAGTCGGTTTVLLNNAPVANLVSSASTLVSGAVASSYSCSSRSRCRRRPRPRRTGRFRPARSRV